MKLFIDTSFLLSVIFEEPNTTHSEEILKKSEFRIGSFLLKIEANQSILRRCKVYQLDPKPFLKHANSILDEIELYNWNEDCLKELKSNQELHSLKTLDAIHLTTLFVLHKIRVMGDFNLASYDDQMIRIAKSLNIPIISGKNTLISDHSPKSKKKKKHDTNRKTLH